MNKVLPQRRTHRLGKGRNHNTLASILWPSGQSLPQVFRDIWHERVKQLQSSFQTRIQRVLRRNLFTRLGVRLEERLGSFDEYVAQVV
jgi:hypothetical protein